MIETLEFIADKAGLIMGAAFAAIVIIAVIRSVIRTSRGESVNVPPVGVMNDLPGSVTGINKYDDMSERSKERADKKMGGEAEYE